MAKQRSSRAFGDSEANNNEIWAKKIREYDGAYLFNTRSERHLQNEGMFAGRGIWECDADAAAFCFPLQWFL